MSKLSVNCNTVEEYFSLPKEKREYIGLYKVPIALPVEWLGSDKFPTKGWTSFYEQIKRQYPLQYFLRYWLVSYNNPLYKFIKSRIYFPVKDLKWAVKLFFSPCHPRWRKVLPRYKYSDITELMVKSNFALILDFYYEEVENGWVDWTSDKAHKTFYKELTNAVKWIEEGEPELEKAISEALHKAHTKRVYKKDGKFDYETTYKKMHALEQEFERKQTQILQWFIENRKSFWT